ncbi:unnamed protein product [Chironomus riparius]|uniref:C2H2-type domain-containing protein n=1 Tax=Chironomus riparius TaxID=315576 RepID=A0A9N9S4Z4_9DIPT|nr:unnamed protein product [Chironomus riparius]
MDGFDSIKIEIPENFHITLIEPEDDEFEQQFEIIQDDNSGLESKIDNHRSGLKAVETANSKKSNGYDVKKRRAMSEDEDDHKSGSKSIKTPSTIRKTSIKLTTPDTSASQDEIISEQLQNTKKPNQFKTELNRLKIHGRPSDYFSSFSQLPKDREARRKAASTSKLIADIINQNEELDVFGGIKSIKSEISHRNVPKTKFVRKSDNFIRNSENDGRNSIFLDRFAQNSVELASNSTFSVRNSFNLNPKASTLGSTESKIKKSATNLDQNVSEVSNNVKILRNSQENSKISPASKMLINPANFIKNSPNFNKTLPKKLQGSSKNPQNCVNLTLPSFKEPTGTSHSLNQTSQPHSKPSSQAAAQTQESKRPIKEEPISPQKQFASPEKMTIKIDPTEFEQPRVFNCNRCRRTFGSIKSLENHKYRVHSNLSSFVKNVNKIKKYKECQFCGATVTLPVVKLHEKRKQKFGTCHNKICPICHEPLIKLLDEHMKEQHPKVRNFCIFCGKKLKTWVTCLYHMKNNHGTEYAEWRAALRKNGEKKFAEASAKDVEQDYFHEVIVNHLNLNESI